ncbi:MAG TPA: sigma-70 family RNA polymerase sigma factor [Tepidisphaeraceae bacterium]|nr:sigma-70 family RNA polymerase sigma factor [Tepidisphaeraceae bacterium]
MPTAVQALLTQQIKSGSPRAYESLLKEYGPRLLATARRISRNEDDAQDILQDAMVLCLRNVGDFKGDSSLYTWLHRVVVTTALMRLRKSKRRNETAIEPLLPAYFDDGHRVGARGGRQWADSIDAVYQRLEVRELVRACIDKLPDTYRDVIILRDIEEMDTTSAAGVLGVNDGAVKTRLHRARQALRTLLEPYVASERKRSRS